MKSRNELLQEFFKECGFSTSYIHVLSRATRYMYHKLVVRARPLDCLLQKSVDKSV